MKLRHGLRQPQPPFQPNQQNNPHTTQYTKWAPQPQCPLAFFIPIHIKPQGQKPPAAHGTPPITSHNIFINPQNLRLINRIFCVLFAANPPLPPNFTAIKFTAIKFKRLFEVYKSTSLRVNRSTSFWELTRWGITYRSATSRFGVRFSP